MHVWLITCGRHLCSPCCVVIVIEDVRIRPITALHVLERVFHVMTDGRLLNPLVASLMGGGGCAADAQMPSRPFAGGLASGVLASPFARSEYPSLWVRIYASAHIDWT